MKLNRKIYYAVLGVLGAHAVAAAAEGEAPKRSAPTNTVSEALQEVIVTAQRRAENIQDVPITVQALTDEVLTQLNVQTFAEAVKYLPNVTQFSAGPAQGQIYMRGLSLGGYGYVGSGTTHAFPPVAIYLDEQSGQLPGRNLDIYAADLERIEVLEGPQGTLFGGGALTGVLRYVTNKPKLDRTEGSVEGSYGVTKDGGPNASGVAVINIPLLEDRLAVRGVIFSDRRGGYIDNLPATFQRSSTDRGIVVYNNGVVPTNSLVIDNRTTAGKDINPVTFTGIRASMLWKINDDWDVLLSHTYQDMDSQGVFYQMPFSSDGTYFDQNRNPTGSKPLPDLSVTTFTPSWNKDKFENTALVVNGQIGDLSVIYSGAYLSRDVDQQQDYTNYARGYAATYYQCVGYSSDPSTGQCFTPAATWKEIEKNTHLSQELRLSTPSDWRLRGTVGVYWDNYRIDDYTLFDDVTVPACSPNGPNVNCFLPHQPWPGSPYQVADDTTGFFNNVRREVEQLAEFLSLDFDIIPDVLTITGGIRHFKYDNSVRGGNVGPWRCLRTTPVTDFGPCPSPSGTDMGARNPNSSHPSGVRSRAGINWHITDDQLLYYTFSEGFRAGYFNRSATCHLPGPDGVRQYCIPIFTVPDNVTNNEIGWKSEWLDGRLMINVAVYQEEWKNAQVRFFDPRSLGSLGFGTNGPTFRVRGFEPQIMVRPISGLTFQFAGAYNKSKQTNSPYLVVNNPDSVNYGQPLTDYPNPYGPLGSPTAYSPDLSFSTRLRYERPFGDSYMGAFQIGAQHRGDMVTATGYSLGSAYTIPAITTFDVSLGISKDRWSATLFSQNVTNVIKPTTIDISQWVLTEFPNRPRQIGLRVGYSFGDD
ncbi:MAG TPA: TonB-dependent receptor [Steroidobacter sp.]|uniref:TonB-dependent receptor n=1 Tax=Steroidobacter sp. TaxID=1978227 RepID=UPI002ED9ED4D